MPRADSGNSAERSMWVLLAAGVAWIAAGLLIERLVSQPARLASALSPSAIASLGTMASILAFAMGIALARRGRMSGRGWALGVLGGVLQGAALTIGAVSNHKSLFLAAVGGLALGILTAAFMAGTIFWYEHVGGREYLLGLAAVAATEAGRRSKRRRAIFLLAVYYGSLFGVWLWEETPLRRKHGRLSDWLHAGLSAAIFSTAVMVLTLAVIGASIGIRRWMGRRS